MDSAEPNSELTRGASASRMLQIYDGSAPPAPPAPPTPPAPLSPPPTRPQLKRPETSGNSGKFHYKGSLFSIFRRHKDDPPFETAAPLSVADSSEDFGENNHFAASVSSEVPSVPSVPSVTSLPNSVPAFSIDPGDANLAREFPAVYGSPGANAAPPLRLQQPQYVKIRRKGSGRNNQPRHIFFAQELKPPENGAIRVAQFSRNGKYLATSGDFPTVYLWQVLTTPLQRSESSTANSAAPPVFAETPVRRLTGHTAHVIALDWSKNGFLLSASQDGTVRLWHPDKSDCLGVFPHPDFVTCVSFHPSDDRFFVSGCLDRVVRLWSVLRHNVEQTAELPDMVTAASFSPDGDYVVVGTFSGHVKILKARNISESQPCALRSWYAKKPKVTGVQVVEHVRGAPTPSLGTVLGGSFTWSGKILISANDSVVRLYNVGARKLEAKFRGAATANSHVCAQFSDDGRFVLSPSEDQYVYIWPFKESEAGSGGGSGSNSRESDSSSSSSEGGGALLGPLHVFRKRHKHKLQSADPFSFRASGEPLTVALMAPTATRRLLALSSDPIYDLCPVETCAGSAEPQQAYQNGNIIVTADLAGVVRVFREDCAHDSRKLLQGSEWRGRRSRAVSWLSLISDRSLSTVRSNRSSSIDIFTGEPRRSRTVSRATSRDGRGVSREGI